MQLPVYCPKPSSPFARAIAAGSGIVGDPNRSHDGLILVYYEGNLYGAVNMQKYSERVLHAADRLATRYPTIACQYIPADQLKAIGTYDRGSKGFALSDPEALRAWCPDADILTGPAR